MTKARAEVQFSPKTGRIRKHRAKPSLGLNGRLANLHMLLRANSFRRWPLKVTFYAEDVFRYWTKWTKQRLENLPPGIDVTYDDSSPDPPRTGELWPTSTLRIHSLDVGYNAYKATIMKRQKLLNTGRPVECGICRDALHNIEDLILTCHGSDCDGLFHLDCLATSFLHTSGGQDALVPSSGNCPKCNTKLRWSDLVKELSLSIRGHKETEHLFKKCRGRTSDDEITNAVEIELSEEEDSFSDGDLERERWETLGSSSDEGTPSLCTKTHSIARSAISGTTPAHAAQGGEYVIEDSDWDEAEILI
nr:structure-specific endonuclease subunit slx1 [Quercus suber]